MRRLQSRNPHSPSAAGKEVLVGSQQFFLSPNNHWEQIHICCCTHSSTPLPLWTGLSFLLLSGSLFSTEPSTHTKLNWAQRPTVTPHLEFTSMDFIYGDFNHQRVTLHFTLDVDERQQVLIENWQKASLSSASKTTHVSVFWSDASVVHVTEDVFVTLTVTKLNHANRFLFMFSNSKCFCSNLNRPLARAEFEPSCCPFNIVQEWMLPTSTLSRTLTSSNHYSCYGNFGCSY